MVSHVSILQCLIAYFRNTPVEKCMSIEVPLHTVIKFTPLRGGGFAETRHPLQEAVGLDINMKAVQSASEISCLSNNDEPASPIWGDRSMRRIVKTDTL